MDFVVSLPIKFAKGILAFNAEAHQLSGSDCEGGASGRDEKLFKVSLKIASKLDGKDLNEFLKNKKDHVALPQDFIQALDVVLRENPTEKCFPVSRSLYSSSMGSEVIGGGAVGLRGFFQSLRATQQGLALNVDFSVTAFHESIGIIPYLQKRCEFLHDLQFRKSRVLSAEEKKEVEKTLKNMKVFVCHRATDQRYRVQSLTDEVTDALTFKDRDGNDIRVIDYFKEHYNHNIEYVNLPCLQIGRSKPCYLPMELCVVCEGQKFLGKLSDDQTAKILRMGCQKPRERQAMIKGVLGGSIGPRSGNYDREFKIYISQEMTKLNGRILQPPKLKLGNGGQVKDLTPFRQDRQWNLLESHVVEGRIIARWALISFGGNADQRSNVGKFIVGLAQRCAQLGISLNRSTIVHPRFEQMQTLENANLLEAKLRKIYDSASRNLDLLVCVMERKHRGYADLKRICETSIGVVTQCCLYSHFYSLSSQYLANLALKINAKVGGSTVALYNPLPRQLPRLFSEPAIFFGADVTHPHPMDDKSPSIAAVVASMNWPAANKYVARMRTQAHRKEIIEGLGEMVGELLEDYKDEIKQLPRRILFFRDGVSEGQFYKVLEEELRALKVACQRFENYNPTITFAVVQKRHHTRLFHSDRQATQPVNSYAGGRVHHSISRNAPPAGKRSSSSSDACDNIPPGTVVDTLITHPREFDFYLCSHSGIKGTSRPTHYHVLWDENHFLSDELQQLINNLCYTFVGCTNPVSLVPHAYYTQLEFLNLSRFSKLVDLPDTLGDLSSLKVLNLNSCLALHILPSMIGMLKDLKHLKLDACYSLRELPKNLSQLTSLNTLILPLMESTCAMGVQDLSKLSNLMELTTLVKSEIEVGTMNPWSEMRKLTLEYDHDADADRDAVTREHVILQNMGNMKKLQNFQLVNYQGVTLPNSICELEYMKMLLLHSCYQLKALPSLDVVPTPDEIRSESAGNSFSMLEKLVLRNLLKLESIARPSGGWNEGTMSKLQLLVLVNCPSLKTLPLGMKLPCLKELHITMCNQLIKLDVGNDGFPMLEMITLDELNSLESIEDSYSVWDERTMSKLQILEFIDCPLLKRLPLGMENLSSLRKINGELDWWQRITWQNDEMKARLSNLFMMI